MGKAGRSARRAEEALRKLEKLIEKERGMQTVRCDVLLRDEFKGLRVKQLAERFPSLSVLFPMDPNGWTTNVELRLRGQNVLLVARGTTDTARFVSRREFFLMAAEVLSSHGFQLRDLGEDILILRRKVAGNERIGRLVSALKEQLGGLLVRAERLERTREKKKVTQLVNALRVLDGSRLGAARTSSLVFKMLLSSVYPELAAYLLFVVEPKYERAMCDAVLKAMGLDERNASRALHDAWTFGMIKVNGDSVSLTPLGRSFRDLLHRIAESGCRIPESKAQTWKYRIHNLMNYVVLKFPRKLSKISQRMRENPQALEKVSRIVAENLTFIDVLSCFYVFLGLKTPEWLRAETLEKLVGLGMLSKYGKLRPFGKALAMCFLDYLKDTGIVDEDDMPTLAEWTIMLELGSNTP
ncbi:MAG: hypothetical protein NYU90_07105 [Aigarchaeota archaeon]|nr:hypothetical protein [Candidatus Calditenuis fumarioli]